jgi:hypothetical protein
MMPHNPAGVEQIPCAENRIFKLAFNDLKSKRKA